MEETEASAIEHEWEMLRDETGEFCQNCFTRRYVRRNTSGKAYYVYKLIPSQIEGTEKEPTCIVWNQ